MNTEANAHNMLLDAAKDFSKISPDNSGRLNLVDIANYEKTGPQQKAVGQFLERNFNQLRGFDKSQGEHGYIDLKDIETAALYTDTDKGALSKVQSIQYATDQLNMLKSAAAIEVPMTVAGTAMFGAAGLAVTGTADLVGTTLASMDAVGNTAGNQFDMTQAAKTLR